MKREIPEAWVEFDVETMLGKTVHFSDETFWDLPDPKPSWYRFEPDEPRSPFWYPSGMPSAEDLDAVAEEEKAREKTK